MLHRVIYHSKGRASVSFPDIEGILAASRANNAAAGITGVLIFADGAFLQVLEGERDAVLRLLGKIACDDRHQGIMVMSAAEIDSRDFERWTMAYLDAGGADLAAWAGLDGAQDVTGLTEELRRMPSHISGFLEGIVEVLSDHDGS